MNGLPAFPTASPTRLRPGTITLLYAAFAVLWIVASTVLLSIVVDDPALQMAVELGKGLLFVVVSSTLLYLVLRPAAEQARPALLGVARERVGWRLLAVLALVTIVPLAGFLVEKVHGPQIEREAAANLEAIAELKGRQIENWLDERYNDGALITALPGFIQRVATLRAAAGREAVESIRGDLAEVINALQYDAALVVDARGKTLIDIGGFGRIAPTTAELLPKALASSLTLYSEIYVDEQARLQINIVVPLLLFEDGRRRSVGVVLLRVSAERFLLPYIKHWPTPSASGESLLVRRDGDALVFINALRHRAGDGSSHRLPIVASGLPAGLGLDKAASGTFAGMDYQGVPTLTAYRRVGGTNWIVLAKIDRAEILEPLHRLAFWVSAITLLALAAICAVMLLLWRQHGRTLHLEMEVQSNRALRQFFDLPFIGIAISSPTTRQWLKCNDRMCEILGYSHAEITAMSWTEMTHPDDVGANVTAFEAVLRGESEGYALEKRFLRKDGSVVLTSLDVKCVRDAEGRLEYLFATVQDITESKLAEAKIQRLTRIYAALSDCNQAIVRCSSPEELFPQVCRFAVEQGGMKMAWVGLIDAQTRLVQAVYSFGDETDYLQSTRVSVDPDSPYGAGAAAVAIRELAPVWVQDFKADPVSSPCAVHGARAGWQSMASLPLLRDGAVIGALTLYAGEVGAFDETSRNLLNEMAIDISFALTAFAQDSARRAMEEQLRLSAKMFEQGGEGIVITDEAFRIVLVNRAFVDITGYSAAEVEGKNPSLLASGRHDAHFFRAMWETIDTAGFWQGELWNRRKDGEVYPQFLSISKICDDDGKVTHYIGTFSDISESKASQAHIAQLAHYDALTGLPNRSLLADRVSQSLSAVERNGQSLALVFLDLDRFKNVNDSLGHRIGDELLIQVADRLKLSLREVDTVSRLGGDEFILVLPGADADGATHVAEKVIKVLAQPYRIEQFELAITPSLGIAMYPADGVSYETLSMCADAAMYRAKQGGRNTFRFFTKEMQERSDQTLLVENALRRALELNQLTLNFQPQIALDGDKVIGVEALLRWHHPELGNVAPSDFIPVAEDTGLILPIGEWVLRNAVRQLTEWIGEGMAPIVMAVNLSAIQFRQVRLPELISEILAEYDLPPHLLELELTEGVAMDNPLAAISVMNDLHARGVRMSIDDFGTGYSSLSYLKRFKVSKLKIDKSFVRDISTDPENAAIVQAIIGLSRSLGLETIAEGVETAEQLSFLRANGCGEVQGYFVGRPMPAADFAAYVRASSGAASPNGVRLLQSCATG